MLYISYRTIYPHIPFLARKFFDMQSAVVPSDDGLSKVIKAKRVLDFLQHIKSIYPDKEMPQPEAIDFICKKMCSLGFMNSSNPEISPSIGGMNNTYICVATQDQDTRGFRCLLDNLVYGWTSVYENNRASVIAIQHENYFGDLQLGTAFYLSGNFIVTARHCIKNANSLALQSVSSKILNECRIVISKNEALDLALIEGGDFNCIIVCQLCWIPGQF